MLGWGWEIVDDDWKIASRPRDIQIRVVIVSLCFRARAKCQKSIGGLYSPDEEEDAVAVDARVVLRNACCCNAIVQDGEQKGRAGLPLSI